MKTKTSILQNPLTARSWRSCLQLLVALALLGWSAMAHAAPQTDTWTGGGADNNWNTALNWNTPVTTSGDDLIFAASPRPAPNNDFTGLQIDSITFNTNGYALSGNALTITNGITDNAGSNSCSIPLTLGASQTFQNTAGGITTIGGTIALGTNNLTIAGSASVYLNGIISSTTGGKLTVNSGLARLGPSSGSTGNTFGTNTVLLSTTSTNITYSTNTTYITNLFVDGLPVNIVTNTVVTTNNAYTYVTNGIVRVLDAVTVNGGTLQLYAATAAGAAIIPDGISVGNVLVNGTLDLNGISPNINGLEGSGTVDSVTNTATSTLTMGNGDSNAVFSGVIQNTAGSVAVTKTGWGTETLNGPNSYSGPTIVNQGKLVVGASGSLGLSSKVLTIESGAILDVTALGVNGYYPQGPLNVGAGTPTKPYTNFWGSYNTSYPAFVVTPSTNYYTVTNVVTGVSTNYTTNVLSYAYSTNSIISVITNDINGNFSVLGGGSISPVTAVAPGIATWTINGSLIVDTSLGLGPPNNVNQVNFLLNDTTTPGGGTNDLIVVNGTLYIGDELDFVVSPFTGTLAAGKYTLIESTNYVPTSPNDSAPANLVLIAPRGITGTFDTSSQPGNILLQITSFVASPASIVWAGTPTVNNWDTHVTKDWTNSGSLDYFYSQDNVIFDDTGVGTINLPIPVTPGSMTFNNNKTNYTFNASSTAFVNGTGGLTLNGSGSVTLNNPNSFTGPTTINNGRLILGSYGGYGNVELYNGVAPGQLVFGGIGNNEIFVLNDTIVNSSQSPNLAGFTLNPGANAQIASGDNVGLGPRGSGDIPYVTIGGNIIRNVGSSLYMNVFIKGNTANSGVYFTNTIPWSNGLLGGGWAHIGTDWLLAQTNINNGNSPVSGIDNYAGYSNNTALATWLPTNNMSVSNFTFAVTASATVNTLKLSGPATVTTTAGQTLTIQTGGLLVSSAGAGASTITGGTLEGAAGADLIVLQNYTLNPLTIGSIIANNGSATALTLGGLGGTLILTNNNTYTGATYINNGSLQVGAGSALGSIATSSSIFDNGTLSFNRPDATSVGAVSGTGSLTQLGAGTLTLTGNNTLSGLVTISAGTLQLGTGGAAGSVSNAVGLVDNGTLVFNNSGTVGYPQVISGSGGLVQAGAGTLIIGTNETYSGNTIVSNGAVVLTASGSISNTAAIVVNAGAVFDASAAGGLTLRSAVPSEILGGSGTVKGTVTTASGTTLTPGTNGVVGTLTINNNLTLNGGNYVFDVSINPSASDKILVGGILTQTSGNVLINVSGAPLTNGIYRLIYATNGLSGSVTGLAALGFGQIGQLAFLTNATANELDLIVVSGVNPTVTWQGDGSLNLWDTTSSSKWVTNGVTVLYQNGDYVIFNDSGSSTPPVNIDAVVSPSGITVNSTNENYTLGLSSGSGANKITGGGSLVKNGSGTLTLQTVNDYSAGTAINGGVVQLNGDGGANDDGMLGSGSVTNNGTLIANNANTETIAGNISGNGLLVQQGVGKLILSGNNTAYAGPITFINLLQVGNGVSGTLGTGNVTNNGTLLFNVGGSVAVNANISGSGNVTNLGGTVTLNGTDTYAGKTTISNGTLRVGSANALPGTTTVVLNDSGSGAGTTGTLDLNGFSPVIASLGGTNTGASTASFTPCEIVNNGSGTSTLTISGPTTNTFYGQIQDNNNSGSGKVALALRDGPVMTLEACATASSGVNPVPNSFSGGIIISNATLFLGISSGSTYVANEGTYVAGGNPIGSQNITLEGTNGVLYGHAASGSVNDQAPTTIGILNVPTGQTGTMNAPARATFTCTLQGGGNLTYWATYSRGKWAGDLSAFTGTLTLAQTNQPGGTAGNGNLVFIGNNGLPNAAVIFQINNVGAWLQVAGGTSGNVFPIGSLAGGDTIGELGGGTDASGDGTANTIWAIGSLNTSTTFGGQITDTGCGIRKVGYGTLTLTNNILSWGGQCVVSNGTLAFAPLGNNPGAFIALTNNYLVASNYTIVSPGTMDVSAAGGTLYLGHNGAQTLFGNGTLNGNLVVTNSLIAPARRASDTNTYTGSGLTVNNSVKLGFGSSVLLTITNSPANDSLTAASIIYGGALVVTNLGGTAYANGSSNVFRLFKITGNTISGTFTNITLPTLPANERWVTNLSLDGSIALVNTNAAINANPPPMQISFNGTQLTLGWPTNLGWILQSQTNSSSVGLSTNWFDVAGSAAQTNMVITINPANPTVFYRLRLP